LKDWKRTKANLARAKAAEVVLSAYRKSRTTTRPRDYEIGDVIADMLHLAARCGYEPDEILSSARNVHFEAERQGKEE
jgi:hypothetical protein